MFPLRAAPTISTRGESPVTGICYWMRSLRSARYLGLPPSTPLCEVDGFFPAHLTHARRRCSFRPDRWTSTITWRC